MTQTKRISAIVTMLAVTLSGLSFPPETKAQTNWETRDIIFPVIGAVTYYDDFGAARDGGARQHEGQDLMGRKLLPLVAAVDGRVSVSYPQETWGYSVTIRDEDDYSYHYLHINNDNPGTDDGQGGGMHAYAIDVDDGAEVKAGQLIGWMGDSGNAETTTAHLHFEIRRPDRTPISPYNSLKAATRINAPVERPAQDGEILPYGNFQGGAFIALGNLDNDSAHEVAVGAGPGGGPHVRILDQDGDSIRDIFPYHEGFRGGVDVAVADVNGDGEDDLITAPNSRGGPHVKIFEADGTEIGGFMAYDPAFTGGVNVTAADIDDDGAAEIITAPNAGGGPHVRAFKADGSEVLTFFAYDPAFTGGVDVAAYGSGDDVYIVTAPGNGHGPEVHVYDEDGDLTSSFLAYDAAHRGGVRVSLGRTSARRSQPYVTTAPQLGGSQVKTFSLSGSNQQVGWEFERWWNGSWDVASAGSETLVSTNKATNRRTSIRQVDFDDRDEEPRRRRRSD